MLISLPGRSFIWYAITLQTNSILQQYSHLLERPVRIDEFCFSDNHMVIILHSAQEYGDFSFLFFHFHFQHTGVREVFLQIHPEVDEVLMEISETVVSYCISIRQVM